MKFSIITPCYNAAESIMETACSVRAQLDSDADISIEYIVCDGGSSDATVEIVAECFAACTGGNFELNIISEKDHGMYEALAKGLQKATGDICCYLNAGDSYSPYALGIVNDLFFHYDIKWLKGFDVIYNEKSQIIWVATPFKYRKRLFQCGVYGGLLPYVQQESVFWHRDLNQSIDYQQLSSFKLAGDYYLWKTFAGHAELNIVMAWLGGFKVHRGQLSENIAAYREEMARFTRKPNPIDWCFMLYDRVLWQAPPVIKKKQNPASFYVYNHQKQMFE